MTSNMDIIMKFKAVSEKDYPSTNGYSFEGTQAYEAGVLAVKTEMAKLIIDLLQLEVSKAETGEKLVKEDVLAKFKKVSAKNFPDDLRVYLKLDGYVVEYSNILSLWTASKNHIAVLRGGAKTEGEAWLACFNHYKR